MKKKLGLQEEAIWIEPGTPYALLFTFGRKVKIFIFL
jgi:hypothetical protein